MEQVRYMISDAARMLALEQHVLRYWEDELQLEVPRNEMGHRYYTDENIKEFLRIKELREQGYQLKAIRMYLKKEKQIAEKGKEAANVSPDMDGFVTLTSAKELGIGVEERCAEISEAGELHDIPEQKSGIKLEQFRALMTEIVGQAMQNNNESLTTHIEERILKEMNYLMHEHYEMEQDYYKKLDEAIRGGIKKRREERKRIFAKKSDTRL